LALRRNSRTGADAPMSGIDGRGPTGVDQMLSAGPAKGSNVADSRSLIGTYPVCIDGRWVDPENGRYDDIGGIIGIVSTWSRRRWGCRRNR
jgi:hypothetical protein